MPKIVRKDLYIAEQQSN